MKYLSLDLETTGLDPAQDQILMLSTVVEDTDKSVPVEQLPHLTRFVVHPRYSGNEVALGMNGWIFKHLANLASAPYPGLAPMALDLQLREFIFEHFGFGKVTVAGKNVAGFDIPFLKTAGFKAVSSFRHRVIDPGSVLIDWTKDCPLSLGELKQKTLGNAEVAHDAYQDALDVIRVLRTTYR